MKSKWAMRKSFLIPARDSRHRTACFALYRALLNLAPHVPLPSNLATAWGPKNPIAHLIRRAFRRNRADVSPRLVYPALKAGYRFLALLQGAQTPSSPEHDSVLSFLEARLKERNHTLAQKELHPPNSKNPVQMTSAPSPLSVPLLVNVTPDPTPENPNPKPVYAAAHRPRPLSELPPGATRKIPKFDIASDFPILRLDKPQPPVLSRVLRQKIVKRQERITKVMSIIEDELPEWADEDAWERNVADLMEKEWTERQCVAPHEQQIQETVAQAIWEHQAEQQDENVYKQTLYKHGVLWLNRVLSRERDDAVARADAMRVIIAEEKALAEKEKHERAAERRCRWEEKMRELHGEGWEQTVEQANAAHRREKEAKPRRKGDAIDKERRAAQTKGEAKRKAVEEQMKAPLAWQKAKGKAAEEFGQKRANPKQPGKTKNEVSEQEMGKKPEEEKRRLGGTINRPLVRRTPIIGRRGVTARRANIPDQRVGQKAPAESVGGERKEQ
ncbi:uncharacterized protein BCR38DRAFT_441060 [Pseudomassariella vexata]|uniref:Uncharacterized protein n=1 Tax=Pseudomassariella vexata TaxID=1141098 RepID=A0A1Y2DR96_9PEZI|nr:uncharacterized protein BCR38DRAFT_441060 [Pseudomassariella vexata]ORY61757.1 hypothetical protein BCR38DRAFT_441060 [Pseudomassariella vexata]